MVSSYGARGTPQIFQVSCNGCAGDSFALCFSSGLDACAQMLTGRLSALHNISSDDKNNIHRNDSRGGESHATSELPVIFGESCERVGRPAAEGDGVSGAGARVMSVSEWVGVYGECAESLLCSWVYGGK